MTVCGELFRVPSLVVEAKIVRGLVQYEALHRGIEHFLAQPDHLLHSFVSRYAHNSCDRAQLVGKVFTDDGRAVDPRQRLRTHRNVLGIEAKHHPEGESDQDQDHPDPELVHGGFLGGLRCAPVGMF